MEETPKKDDEQSDLPHSRAEQLAAAHDRLSRHAFEPGPVRPQ